jgi:hypothetical protein
MLIVLAIPAKSQSVKPPEHVLLKSKQTLQRRAAEMGSWLVTVYKTKRKAAGRVQARGSLKPSEQSAAQIG